MSTERDHIIDRVGNDDPDWLAAAHDATVHVARHQFVVTTDDLWPLVRFPAGAGGGRAMGKVIKHALVSRVLEKARSGRFLLCLDHADLDPVLTLDGTEIRHQGPLVVYESLVFDPSASADSLSPRQAEDHPVDIGRPEPGWPDGQAS